MIAVCDGCGKQVPADSNWNGWFKPHTWFQRTPEGENRPIMACSRQCIEKVEEKRRAEGNQNSTVVLPI